MAKINEGYRKIKDFDDLSKLPSDMLLRDLKNKYSTLVQQKAAGEAYIEELEQEKKEYMRRTEEDKAEMRRQEYVRRLVSENDALRKKCRDLELINNRYLVKIMEYERLHTVCDAQ